MKKKIYLANAFSLQMLPEDGVSVEFEVVETLPDGLVSAVGHADTARVLDVEYSRVSWYGNGKMQERTHPYLGYA